MITVYIYIVGKVTNDETGAWEFAGAFTSRKQAEAACLDRNYFVGPAKLNEYIPEERTIWPDAYFPKIGPYLS